LADAALVPFGPAPAELLDELPDALLWFDARAVLQGANRAARRSLHLQPGSVAAEILGALDDAAARWWHERPLDQGRWSGLVQLSDGARLRLQASRLAEGGCSLRLQWLAPALARQAASQPRLAGAAADLRSRLALLWPSPLPLVLLDDGGRIVDGNHAAAGLFEREGAQTTGCGLASLMPEEDAWRFTALWNTARESTAAGDATSLPELRLTRPAGGERWVRPCLVGLSPADPGADDPRQPRWLCWLLDSTGEHLARQQADRSLSELAQWFELSPAGMLVYDQSGLILRSNPAFESQVGHVPVSLDDAGPDLQALLAWGPGLPGEALRTATSPLDREAVLPLPDGRRRRLRARLTAFETRQGEVRTMAVVEDRSAEEERDIARLEMGALMHTAGVGVATFDASRGVLMPLPVQAPSTPQAGARGGGQLGISRDIVDPASRPEFERLQRALRLGERAEVRFSVRHPELGQRWLLTRAQPGALADGRPTMSVVTLDVTDQEEAQRRNDQLLRELTTILDGSTAGIAYLRGALLVRCNLRFERLLSIDAGAAAGASLDELFARWPSAAERVRGAHAELTQGVTAEVELPLGIGPQGPVWLSLSLRRADASAAQAESVAVLSDISRLKSQQDELAAALRERELMFSLSEVGIVYLRGRRIERANQAMARLTGYAAPELTLLDGSELHADARACVEYETAMAAALRQQGRYSAEWRLRRRDGSLRWVEVAARPVDPDDVEAGVICSYVDVDERFKARESLASQAERTRAILDSVLVGIVTVSERGIEWMNRSARRMFGGELADFVGEPISIAATPEADHPLRRQDWLSRLAEGQAETFECRIKARDGREFWVAGNAVVTGRESTTRQLTFALLDIERRRQAEFSIARAQASLQRVIETAPLAIALFDTRSLRLLQLNQMAGRFFGADAARLQGASLSQGCDSARAATLEAWLVDAAGASGVWQREWDDAGTRPGEERHVWDLRLVPLEGQGGAAPQMLLVASDVTERRAADEARLQAAIAQREVLVREVHHRIKNNLQGVAGLLQQNAQRRPEVAETLTEAVGQVQAIAQVYGLQVGSHGPLQAVEVVRAIATSVQRTFGRAIEVEVAAGLDELVLPEAEAIPIALTLNELLTNAIKHGSGEQVQCRLSTPDDEDAACLQVTMTNLGRLPAGFDLERLRAGISGLGLVRALLPRRSASLTLRQLQDRVAACVVLRAPSVKRERAGLSTTMPVQGSGVDA
jgi:PAS domain S-box-containing protein